MNDDSERYLLTPGPLTTAAETRSAMLRDWGSRDDDFIALTRSIRERLTALAGASASHTCVPIQGSGTYAIEAAVGTLVPPGGKLLVLVNGAYGLRIQKICGIIGRDSAAYEVEENAVHDPQRIDEMLTSDPSITHVAAIHCETTSGILNPIAEIADAVARRGRRLLIDAMSSFGAIDLEVAEAPCEAIISSANKCLEGVPGLGFVIAETAALAECAGNAPSLSLDLHGQWAGFERSGEWRFTPPTHVIAAFDQALAQHVAEGGVAGRGARYRENCATLGAGMRALGFETFLPKRLQAPIIVTFLMPSDPAFEFRRFYDEMHRRGFVLYPGKLTRIDSFRIGCIGHIGKDVIERALEAVRETLAEMGVASGAPLLSSVNPAAEGAPPSR